MTPNHKDDGPVLSRWVRGSRGMMGRNPAEGIIGLMPHCFVS